MKNSLIKNEGNVLYKQLINMDGPMPQFKPILNYLITNKSAIIANIQPEGVGGIEMEMLAQLHELSMETENNQSSVLSLGAYSQGQINMARLPVSECSALLHDAATCELLGIAAALSGAEPVALGFAAAAATYDAEAVAGGC